MMKKKMCRRISSFVLILCMMLSVGLQVFAAQESEESVSGNGKIEANIYLLYANRLPADVNQPFGAAEFGPSGNDIAYITVTVDLNKVQENAKVWINTSGYQYYSIDSDQRVVGEQQRIVAMKHFWETVIYPAIDQEDRQALDKVFGGAGNFYGYVLKKENYNVWHIDGILAKDPPVYVVELYDYTTGSAAPLFGISDNSRTLPGVSYQNFKTEVERVLGGSNYQYTAETKDSITVNYLKNQKFYEAVITPKNDEGSASSNYHVYPTEGKFGYREITAGVYFLSRMKVVTREISGALSIEKNVTGGAANPKEHFGFGLTLKDAKGKALNGTYKVTYTGIENCTQTYAGQLTFANGAAVISLKHGEKAVISDLPRNSIMTITEEAGTYQVSVKVDGVETAYKETGLNVSIGEKAKAVVFVNNQAAVPLTGRNMEIAPYLVVMGVVVLAGTVYLFYSRYYRHRKY